MPEYRNESSTVIKLGFACLVAVSGYGLVSFFRLPIQPPVPTYVLVTGIYSTGTKTPLMEITFRASDGLSGATNMPTEAVTCRIGDTMPAIRRGMSLLLTSASCSNPPEHPAAQTVR
jgi:hypothetical protein